MHFGAKKQMGSGRGHLDVGVWWQTPLALVLSLISLLPFVAGLGSLIMLAKWLWAFFSPEPVDGWTVGLWEAAQYGFAAYGAAYWPNHALKKSNYLIANGCFGLLLGGLSVGIAIYAFSSADHGGDFGEWLGRTSIAIALLSGTLAATVKIER